MLPDHMLSDPPNPAPFLDAKTNTVEPTTDYETGGIGIQDPSEGLQYQTWTCKTDGTIITIEADNSSPVTVYTGTNITEVSLAFDSNMNYFVAFVEDGQAKYKWWDISVNDYTVDSLGASDINPRCTLDDKRAFNSAGRDIILCYLSSGNLYYRIQRENYDTERFLSSGYSRLINIGMNINNQMQFWVR